MCLHQFIRLTDEPLSGETCSANCGYLLSGLNQLKLFKMKKITFIATFLGRLIGTNDKVQAQIVKVEAADEAAAKHEIYHTYQYVKSLTIVEKKAKFWDYNPIEQVASLPTGKFASFVTEKDDTILTGWLTETADEVYVPKLVANIPLSDMRLFKQIAV